MLFLLCILTLFTCLEAYPDGAPESACGSMTPSHYPPSNTGQPPFQLTVSRQDYEPGSVITVTLSNTSSTPFKGFLIQARSADGSSTAVGAFNVSGEPNAQLACAVTMGPRSAVTHVLNDDKDSITVNWTAPDQTQGNIVFRATVVEVNSVATSESRYWLEVDSPIITGDSPGTDTTPALATEVPVTEEPSLPPIDLADCGTNQGCFRYPDQCDSTKCEFVLTWRVRDDYVDFHLSAEVPDVESWTAVGFSKDASMGADSVVDCTYDNTVSASVVRSSWNDPAKFNTPLDDPTLGLDTNLSESASVDGRVQCAFSREIIVPNNNQELVNDASKIYNLTSAYFLLLARGPSISGFVQQHMGQPPYVISPNTVVVSDPSKYVDLGGALKNTLVIAHGSLMIFAWLVFANVGVLMPRYFKPAWPAHTIRGKQVWFQIHWPVMSLVLCLTLVGFVIIFIEVGGYASYLEGIDAVHPILGIFVTALAITNPIMALFRPHPNTPNRHIFNWAHFTVGTSAQVLGAVTVFLGTNLSKADMSDYARWIVVAAVIWHILAEAALAIHQCRWINHEQSIELTNTDIKDDNKVTPMISMQDMQGVKEKIDSATMYKTGIVITHFIGLLCLALALVVNLAI